MIDIIDFDQPQALTPSMNMEILADFEALLQSDQDSGSVSKIRFGSMSILQKLLNKALVLDFFVVVGFLLWFLVGVALQSSNPAMLLGFQSIFQPVVVPALTVLMVGSIATGIAEKLSERRGTTG